MVLLFAILSLLLLPSHSRGIDMFISMADSLLVQMKAWQRLVFRKCKRHIPHTTSFVNSNTKKQRYLNIKKKPYL